MVGCRGEMGGDWNSRDDGEIRKKKVTVSGDGCGRPGVCAHEEDRDEGEGLRGRRRQGDLGFYFPRSLGSFSLIRAMGQVQLGLELGLT